METACAPASVETPETVNSTWVSDTGVRVAVLPANVTVSMAVLDAVSFTV